MAQNFHFFQVYLKRSVPRICHGSRCIICFMFAPAGVLYVRRYVQYQQSIFFLHNKMSPDIQYISAAVCRKQFSFTLGYMVYVLIQYTIYMYIVYDHS
jgi:hypothetical protein